MSSLLTLAGLAAVLAGALAFVVGPDLPAVDPRDMQLAAQVEDVPGNWRTAMLLMAAGMIASAGLPPAAVSNRSRRSGAAGQLAAAGLILVATLAASFWTTIWTFGSDDPCRYPSCWPAEAQAAAVAAPAVLAAGTLVAAAAARGRLPWTAQAVLPAAVWLAGVALLRVIWEPWLLPVFLNPP